MNEVLAVNPRRYLQAALTNQYNVILFGGSILFSLAFASFLPLLAGIAAEAIWLGVGPLLPAFRRRVDGLAPSAPPAPSIEPARAPSELAAPYAARLDAIGRLLEEIRRQHAAQPGVSPQDRELTFERLRRLRRAFLDFAGVHQRLSRFMQDSPSAELEHEIRSLKQAYAAEKDLGVRLTVRQALTLAERRVKQLEQVASTRRAVEVRLETIEKSFAYARSCVMSFSSPSALHAELDALSAQIGSSAELERTTSGFSPPELHPAGT